VSETMYKETLKTLDPSATATAPQKAFESKVNRICDAFLAVLEQSQHKEDHLQNIITAHVSKTPPDLESGLEMIGRLQGNTSYHTYGSRLLTDVSTEHICFLADVNQLYDTSLGIYNLELALLVAQQSQKVSVSASLIKPSILTHW
jgi:elongator complex protein 1